jgi:dTDP-glucose 4,6-dehydratase
MKLLVTGGCGFIGSNFIYYMLGTDSDVAITNLDKLTYAGNLENLERAHREYGRRLTFIKGDIREANLVSELMAQKFDVVINFAAESHVDRSIEDSSEFLHTNVLGTRTLLEAFRRYGGLFIQISTDEVYGSLGLEGKFTECSLLCPNSPYAASKAAADLLVQAYANTYKLPVVVTRCSNNYGPYQFPEKLIPLMISNALEGEKLPVYGDGRNVRDWIFVEDHVRAIDLIMRSGKPGRVYNIGGGCEKRNLDLLHDLLAEMERQLNFRPQHFNHLITFVADRPGHDLRYAMDFSLLAEELNWRPTYSFEEGIKATVAWYLENRSWWTRIKQGEYIHYYERMYKHRLASS